MPGAVKAKGNRQRADWLLWLRSQPQMDWPLAIFVVTLVFFGLVMLFSASYATAYYRFKGDSFRFIRQQAVFAFAGLIVMYIASRVDYHIFHRLAWPLMALTIVLLIIVLFMPKLNHYLKNR